MPRRVSRKRFMPGNRIKTTGRSENRYVPVGTELTIIRIASDGWARVKYRGEKDWINPRDMKRVPMVHQETGLNIDDLLVEMVESCIGLPNKYVLWHSRFEKLNNDMFGRLESQTLPLHIEKSTQYFKEKISNPETMAVLVDYNSEAIAGMVTQGRRQCLDIHSLNVLPGFNDYSVVQERLLQFAMSNAYFEGMPVVKMGVWQYHPILGVADTLGFEQVGQDKNYYRTGENQLLLEKVLEKEEVMGFLDNLRGKRK